MAVNLLSPRITQGFRNQRDNLTVGDADLIVADLEALNNATPPSGGVQSVTGPIVDNTDPDNPVITIVLPQTLAQAQSNNGSYTKGSWVQVTEDIGGITGSADTIFPVIEGGFLAGTGWCQTFENTGMAATRMVEIDWDVTADFISRIKEPKQGNTVTAHYSTVGLENFPFDTSTILQTTIIDPTVCAIDVAAIVIGATFEEFGTITLGAGTTFRGTAGQEATVTLSGTATFIGSVGDNGGVTLLGTQALNWCKIGVNKNVDCSTLPSGYAQTGKVYEGNYSTFECAADIDINGNNRISINNISGGDYSFCGVFTKLLTTVGAEVITLLETNLTDHDYEVYTISGNFYLADGDIIVPHLFEGCLTSANDKIVFTYNPANTVWYMSPMSYLVSQGATGSFDAAAIAANSATFDQGIFKGLL
jgi:hypothetical protein